MRIPVTINAYLVCDRVDLEQQVERFKEAWNDEEEVDFFEVLNAMIVEGGESVLELSEDQPLSKAEPIVSRHKFPNDDSDEVVRILAETYGGDTES